MVLNHTQHTHIAWIRIRRFYIVLLVQSICRGLHSIFTGSSVANVATRHRFRLRFAFRGIGHCGSSDEKTQRRLESPLLAGPINSPSI